MILKRFRCRFMQSESSEHNTIKMSPTNKNNLEERTFQLQSAIGQISSVRKILSSNSQQIKSQIQANISRQLEALRNREVWLLNQVDVLQSAKEETLRSQQARLDTALGSARKTLQILSDGDCDIDCCDDVMDMNLDELKPQETPHLTFQVNSVGLRENILQYGTIQTAGFHDKSMFLGKHDDSASLPKAFEDYEDDEHHMMYKTFPRVPGCVSLPGSFRRLRPNTAPIKPTVSNAWLLQSSMSSPTVPQPTKPQPSPTFPTLSYTKTDLSDWLQPAVAPPTTGLRHTASDASICSWLHQLKTSPHMEDDEFELIDTMMAASNTDKETTGFAGSPYDLVKMQRRQSNSFFKRLRAQDYSLWLSYKPSDVTNTTQYTPDSFDASREQLNDTSRYYRTISAQNNAFWLINKITKSPQAPSSALNIGDIDIEFTSDATNNNDIRPNQNGPIEYRLWLTKNYDPTDVLDTITYDRLRALHNDMVWLCDNGASSLVSESIETLSTTASTYTMSECGNDMIYTNSTRITADLSRQGSDFNECERVKSTPTANSVFNDISGYVGEFRGVQSIADGFSSATNSDVDVDAMSTASSYDDWLRSSVTMDTTNSEGRDWPNWSRVKNSEVNLWLLKP